MLLSTSACVRIVVKSTIQLNPLKSTNYSITHKPLDIVGVFITADKFRTIKMESSLFEEAPVSTLRNNAFTLETMPLYVLNKC